MCLSRAHRSQKKNCQKKKGGKDTEGNTAARDKEKCGRKKKRGFFAKCKMKAPEKGGLLRSFGQYIKRVLCAVIFFAIPSVIIFKKKWGFYKAGKKKWGSKKA